MARDFGVAVKPVKSKMALFVLTRELVSGLPFLPSLGPPSRLDMQLNASPNSLLNPLRNSVNLGQFHYLTLFDYLSVQFGILAHGARAGGPYWICTIRSQGTFKS